MYYVFSYDYESNVEEEVFSDPNFEVCADVKAQMIKELMIDGAYYSESEKPLTTFHIVRDDGMYVS